MVAEEDAPLVDYKELLAQHPSDASQEVRERQKQVKAESKERVASAQAEVSP